jgi:intracellular septation protein
MKLLLDFLPVLLFFVTFKYGNSNKEWATTFTNEHFGFMVSGGVVNAEVAPMLIATLVVVAATMAQIAYMLVRGKKVGMMLWISLALVTVLGGATVWFHNENFIKWKPTLLYWAMGLSFLISHTFLRKNLLQTLMGGELELPAPVWLRLNMAWVGFFTLMGALNLYVAYTFSNSTWVDFKLFGGIGLMLLFTVAQGMYLMRHIKPDEPAKASEDTP